MSDRAEQQSFHDVASLEEIKEDGLKIVTIGKRSIVLMRREGRIHALGGKCPHKGAPLNKGAYCKSASHGDVLVCPWHKAVFSAETGKVVEPIAFEDLPRYPVEIVQGRIIVGARPLPSAPAVARQEGEHVLVLGGGAAAASVVYTLRHEGFAGKITIIGDEEWAPYDRTMLSKSFLLAEPSRRQAPDILDKNYYIRHNITRLQGRVTALDHHTKTVTLEDGQTLQGDHIVIATGSRPRSPDIAGIERDGVMGLHSQADALKMAEEITPDQPVILIGGGLIGLEVASSLRQKGVGVTIITNEGVPMEAQLGREIGLRLHQLHEENSVAFISDAQVTRIYGEGRVEGVELDDGMRLPCRHVLIATGVQPQSDYVRDSLKGPEGSVLVDEAMRAAPGVYAAGDVAAVTKDGRVWRVEHWRHAQVQGRIAAQAIMGFPVEKMPVPWFWTQQFGKKIEWLGWGEAFDHVLIEGALEDFKFLATYRSNNRVVALSGAGRATEMARAAVSFDEFAEKEAPSVPL
ncbi:FAD-dependent oxidoreductase [Saccharibacter floricola]|uniref:Rubredoxin-NAD reductase n=1 Tax=Saccharibacter floricola DSM 15669 TaxID=1123227 RepID=A0ABQ0P358_9PROT|nr:FAD-dependent oxidoreductase [Saccharibacter floricola]GBQ07581.1 rubredoxin-NAD reductase [Saccharibacter floricola DSM 15669]